MPMTTKPGTVVTYNEELYSIKSEDFLIAWPCNVIWQIKYVIPLLPQWHSGFLKSRGKSKTFISTTTMSETTTISSVVNWREGLPIIKSHDHLIKSLCEITWQIKNIKSDLSQYLWSPNLSEWWLTARSSHSKNFDQITKYCFLSASSPLLMLSWCFHFSKSPKTNLRFLIVIFLIAVFKILILHRYFVGKWKVFLLDEWKL